MAVLGELTRRRPRQDTDQRNPRRRRGARVATAAAITLAAACGPSISSDTRFVTGAQWDEVNNDATTLTVNATVDLNTDNKPGIRRIALTAKPYEGSHLDPELNPSGGYPIFDVSEVRVENGHLVEDDPRLTLTDNGETADLTWEVPLENPSDTEVSQPPLRPGQEVNLFLDWHGEVDDKERHQPNVANPRLVYLAAATS
ncbi:MAG: hypothetical protein AAB553_07435 [Patescibacteria group bacterium]